MDVENGLGAVDQLMDGKIYDDYCIAYLKCYIEQIKAEIEYDGVRLIGYTPWEALDLPSLSTCEMSKRYGFLYVETDDHGNGTYKRYEKDSFSWHKKVCKSNGKDLSE